ncbi:hypothetical protein HDU92_009195 [Lobulomyces angularis]|nr:hypothetical protein HDU92_009195 [Lobulomyces angularis]
MLSPLKKSLVPVPSKESRKRTISLNESLVQNFSTNKDLSNSFEPSNQFILEENQNFNNFLDLDLKNNVNTKNNHLVLKDAVNFISNIKQKLNYLEDLYIERIHNDENNFIRLTPLEPVENAIDILIEHEIFQRKSILRLIEQLKKVITEDLLKLKNENNLLEEYYKILEKNVDEDSLNSDNGSTNFISCYRIKKELKNFSQNLKKTIFERSKIVDEFNKKINDALFYLYENPQLIDLNFNKTDEKHLSLENIEILKSKLVLLENEINIRITNISNNISEAYFLYKELKESPTSLQFELTLDFDQKSFVESKVFLSCSKGLADFFLEFEKIKEKNVDLKLIILKLLQVKISSKRNEKFFLNSITEEEMVKRFIQENESCKEENIFTLFLDNIKNFENRIILLNLEINFRKDLIKTIFEEIKLFWKQLKYENDIENEVKFDLEDLSQIIKMKTYADELRFEWKMKMESTLLKVLKELWNKCHVLQSERDTFLTEIESNLYSPLTVNKLEAKIEFFESRFKVWEELFNQIEDRKQFLQKIKDFEVSASNPSRLKGSSIKLLEEEKFRKICLPTLLQKENFLKKNVLKMEMETGTPFIYQNERFLETLENEIENRYIDTSVFLIDNPVNFPAKMSNIPTQQKKRRSLSRTPISKSRSSSVDQSLNKDDKPSNTGSVFNNSSNANSIRKTKSNFNLKISNPSTPNSPSDETGKNTMLARGRTGFRKK